MAASRSEPIDEVADLKVRRPIAPAIVWTVTFLLALVLFTSLRALPPLFLVGAFVAWCTVDRLRRTRVALLFALLFLGLELFLPFDVSLIDAPGGMKVARVVRGKPSEEALAAAARGEVVLSGCLVSGTEPRRVLVW